MLKVVAFVSFVFISLLSKAQIVSVDNVGGYLGKNVTVFGKISDGRYLPNSTNQPTLLNMGGKYPNQKLTVVVYGPKRVNFGYKPEEVLINKDIYVTGKVELYNGKPQIVIDQPFNIAFSAPGTQEASVATTKEQKKPLIGRRRNNEEKPAVREEEPKQDKPEKAIVKDVPRQEKRSAQEPSSQIIVTTPSPTSAAAAGDIVLGSTLNVKAGPGNKFTTVGSIKKGSSVSVVSTSYGWSKIIEKSPFTGTQPIIGYVKSDKLE